MTQPVLQRALNQSLELEKGRRLRDPRRLEELYATRFYQAPQKDKLREFCQLAIKLLSTPASYVTIISADEVVVVVSVPDFQERNPVEHSYCQYVVGGEAPFIICNSLDDPKYLDLLSENHSTQQGYRAYLGVPLISNGYTIGTFCVADFKPRTWSPTDVMVLTQLGSAISAFHEEAHAES